MIFYRKNLVYSIFLSNFKEITVLHESEIRDKNNCHENDRSKITGLYSIDFVAVLRIFTIRLHTSNRYGCR